jgi:hypothetical protein
MTLTKSNSIEAAVSIALPPDEAWTEYNGDSRTLPKALQLCFVKRGEDNVIAEFAKDHDANMWYQDRVALKVKPGDLWAPLEGNLKSITGWLPSFPLDTGTQYLTYVPEYYSRIFAKVLSLYHKGE